MTYSVKEIYYTLQGEGAHSGRPAVFLRFAGCNLWSGRERDRAASVCKFCDTQFVGTNGPGGGKYQSSADLACAVSKHWPEKPGGRPYVVCTGGEPLLQLDAELIDALHNQGFEIAVETNGTIAAPKGIDWLCVSPKGTSQVVQRSGDELKLVFPQIEASAQPEQFQDWDFRYLYLQPLDDESLADNTQSAIRYCLLNPRWCLSVQAHKILGIP
jgi:7-carboxy-7-deazaguanine synthase